MPSPKILARKKQVVSALADELKGAESMVFTDYKGLTVAQDTEMRAAFRKAGVVYRVVKNSVSSRAFEKIGVTGLDDVLKGPTAIAFSTVDVTTAPRLTKEYTDKFKKTTIKGGILEGAFVDVNMVNELASIPTLEVLYTQLVSTLMYPITKLAITLNLAAEAGGEVKAEEEAEAPAEETAEETKADTPAEEAKESAKEPAEEQAPEPVVSSGENNES